jgi:hypothetical protein
MLVSVATAARGDMQYFAPSTDESLAIALSFLPAVLEIRSMLAADSGGVRVRGQSDRCQCINALRT